MQGSETRIDPDAWDAAIADTDGPQLVVGGPGSGKTEFLVRRARHLIDDTGVRPDHLLLLSFSRRGAADLRTRLATTLDRSFSRIPALTFHSLALQLIEAHGAEGDWPSPPTPLTGPEQVTLVAEVLAGEDPKAWPQPFRGLLGTRSFAADLADFCMRAAERLIGPDEIEGFARADWRAIPGFMRRYRDTLVDRGRIDYGSLQAEAIRLLARPEVRQERGGVPTHILVDEYQDTTVSQATLLDHLAGPGGNLTVAGDPYQSVYSFRGAEVGNIDAFPTRFGSDEHPARRLVLTTSFRVPEAILSAAVRVTAGTGLPGAAGPVIPAPGEGSVETYRFDQQSHEAEWIAGEIQRAHLVGRIPYRDMAVLVRSKRSLLGELARALHRRHIPHEQPDDRLVGHRLVRCIGDLVEAATADGNRRTDAFRRVLLGPLVGLPLGRVREMERTALRGEAWTEVLASDDGAAEIGELVADPTWAATAPASDGFWAVWTTLSVFDRVARDPAAADDRAALASFGQALERLRDRDDTSTLRDYFAAAGAEDFEAEPLLEFRASDTDQVTLTTLHQAKGEEYDVVFIADAREGVLPDLRTRDSILGTRHLSPTHSGDDSAYTRFRIQEEMRLVYTALCRARHRAVVTCTSMGVDMTGGAPSRIIPLIAGRPMEEAAGSPGEYQEPITALEAEAWLRRTARDPQEPAVDRLAALAALTRPGAWRPRDPGHFAGVLDRGPDHGVTEKPLRMSPSRAESYLTCPRRYVLERGLGLGNAGSTYASLGSAIHDALERAESAALARGDDHGTADEALAALDEVFEPDDYGGSPWAEAWHARASWIITRLYDLWPGEGPAVGLEVSVQREIDGVQWVGRIDRVEQRPEGVWVIDYKTGTRVPKTTDAAVSVQLGFYVSAVDASEVAGAEMWFPASKQVSIPRRGFDLSRLPDVEEAMRVAQQGIADERWNPEPGVHCERCPHRTLCPAWPEGAEAYAG
ncbi:MAG TPA: ATP-dependent DNA helicase [Acidimicrobiia bacterium]|nr:ATP-dependent DNA helicase [Acidimicrobiia bacterium]